VDAPIPFNRPFLTGKELGYIAQVLENRKLSGDGELTKRVSRLMETMFSARRVLLTTSCTSALEMAAVLARSDRPDGEDEVIVPGYTFVSSANAFVLHGYRPVFVDVRSDTLNLDETKLEAAITPRTRVIVPVHYAGIGAEMDTIMSIAARHGVMVVEDAAQGVGATYKGRALGTIGDLGCYSFHDTKNIISGEGGALVVNRPDLVARAEIIREKGTDRSRFLRGEIDKYTWVDVGASHLPSELLAAFLLAQLEGMDAIQQRRAHVWTRYRRALAPLEKVGHLRLPIEVASGTNYHMFQILVDSLATRTRLIAHLKARSISAVFHYVPLHTSPMGLRFGRVSLPVVEDIADRLLRLPMFPELSDEQIDRVVAEIGLFYGTGADGTAISAS